MAEEKMITWSDRLRRVVMAPSFFTLCGTRQAGHDQFTRIGTAPLSYVRNVSRVRTKVNPNVPGLLIKPPAHPGGEDAGFVGWQSKIVRARYARHINHDLRLSD